MPNRAVWKVLSLEQRLDGSIYLSFPKFDKAVWVNIPDPHDRMWLNEIACSEKLSLHGSGVAHIKNTTGGDAELRIKGSFLVDVSKREAGLRHVLTLFPASSDVDNAQLSPRIRDVTISTESARPLALVLWAVPNFLPLTVEVRVSFQAADLQSIPPDYGFGYIQLLHHSIVWFAYRTNGMERWPQRPHACFQDGYRVPIFIGTTEGSMRVELRTPQFSFKGGVVRIVA